MKKFREFMRNRGLWDEYKRNVKLCPWYKNVTQYIASSKVELYVHGFEWDCDPRGFDFWSKISHEWMDTL